MIVVKIEDAQQSDAPNVERLRYTQPDGADYRADIARSVMGGWLAQVWDDDGRRIWVSPRPFTSRPTLIRRCTEEIDREARRRTA